MVYLPLRFQQRLLVNPNFELLKYFGTFVTSITDEFLDHLRKCIEKANIVTEVIPVLSRAVEKFSVVDEENLEDFLKAIRTELEKAFQEAKKKNPGKKVRISLR